MISAAYSSVDLLFSAIADFHVLQMEGMEEVVMVMAVPTDMAEEVIHKVYILSWVFLSSFWSNLAFNWSICTILDYHRKRYRDDDRRGPDIPKRNFEHESRRNSDHDSRQVMIFILFNNYTRSGRLFSVHFLLSKYVSLT